MAQSWWSLFFLKGTQTELPQIFLLGDLKANILAVCSWNKSQIVSFCKAFIDQAKKVQISTDNKKSKAIISEKGGPYELLLPLSNIMGKHYFWSYFHNSSFFFMWICFPNMQIYIYIHIFCHRWYTETWRQEMSCSQKTWRPKCQILASPEKCTKMDITSKTPTFVSFVIIFVRKLGLYHKRRNNWDFRAQKSDKKKPSPLSLSLLRNRMTFTLKSEQCHCQKQTQLYWQWSQHPFLAGKIAIQVDEPWSFTVRSVHNQEWRVVIWYVLLLFVFLRDMRVKIAIWSHAATGSFISRCLSLPSMRQCLSKTLWIDSCMAGRPSFLGPLHVEKLQLRQNNRHAANDLATLLFTFTKK